jgi:hypothetical protein
MITEIVVTSVVLGGAYWVYKCQQKEDCSFGGECDTVFEHLKKGGTLTAKQAKKIYGIKHLRSVISRLRHKHGQDIETVVKGNKATYTKK